MRTAAQSKVVAFRTFLRTLLHELAHHLDVTLLGLEESFHTEGFFRRESSLMRQLAPSPRIPNATGKSAKASSKRPTSDTPSRPASTSDKRPRAQLSLF
jgi:hypothetical protein